MFSTGRNSGGRSRSGLETLVERDERRGNVKVNQGREILRFVTGSRLCFSYIEDTLLFDLLEDRRDGFG